MTTAPRSESTFNSLTTDVLNAMGSAAGALKVLGSYGANMVTGWASSMESAVTGSAQLKHLTTDLLNVLGGTKGALNLLYTFGADVMQGLLNGIQSMWNTLTKKLADLGSLIKSIPGGILKWAFPARVMVDMGQDVVRGLILGIDTQQGALRSTMTAMANSVANTSMRPTSYPGGSLAILVARAAQRRPSSSRCRWTAACSPRPCSTTCRCSRGTTSV